ncbi:hypothetical protein BZG36_04013 [Bifiguratus adelaidae]|uniref:RRM domain-containing protein n=1 Tax=Bifiguratus adelaidae TaxID=1938954 RepID=A0A261XYJ8_9FUNG|nr:hypothetical protein BZG36_04013 [Bifiguratus adelaidae]
MEDSSPGKEWWGGLPSQAPRPPIVYGDLSPPGSGSRDRYPDGRRGTGYQHARGSAYYSERGRGSFDRGRGYSDRGRGAHLGGYHQPPPSQDPYGYDPNAPQVYVNPNFQDNAAFQSYDQGNYPPPPTNGTGYNYAEPPNAVAYPRENERQEKPQDERIALERPCRTLFVRNVQYDVPLEEVETRFGAYGEIKDVFNRIKDRGMVFITYYDIRAAERAKVAMQNTQLLGREIDVHYSLPKEQEAAREAEAGMNQGTLLLTLKGTNNPLEIDEVHRYFSSYGEVKLVRDFKDRAQQKFVEFYDSRSADNAVAAANGTLWQDGRLDVHMMWDHPLRDRTILAPKRHWDREPEDVNGGPPGRGDRGGRGRGRRDDRDEFGRDRGARPRYEEEDRSRYHPYGSGSRGRGDRRGGYRGGYDARDSRDTRDQDRYPPRDSYRDSRRGGRSPGPSYGRPPPQRDDRLEQAQSAQKLLDMFAQGQIQGQVYPPQPPIIPMQQPEVMQPAPVPAPTANPANPANPGQVQQLLSLLTQYRQLSQAGQAGAPNGPPGMPQMMQGQGRPSMPQGSHQNAPYLQPGMDPYAQMSPGSRQQQAHNAPPSQSPRNYRPHSNYSQY